MLGEKLMEIMPSIVEWITIKRIFASIKRNGNMPYFLFGPSPTMTGTRIKFIIFLLMVRMVE